MTTLSPQDLELAKKHGEKFEEDREIDVTDVDIIFTTSRLAAMLAERDAQHWEFVGITDAMPGTNGGFTMAAFKSADVPVGAKLFTKPFIEISGEPITHPPKNDQQSITRERFDTILYSNLDHIEGADVDRMYAQLQVELANRKGE